MYVIKEHRKSNADKLTKELDAQIKKYKKDQKEYLKSGGPGPVASFDVMTIVNDHDGKFEVTYAYDDTKE